MLAEQTLGFNAMAFPDFFAGMIFGMTEENHLTEIEICYHGGEGVDSYIKTAFSDFHHGGVDWEMQGIINIGLAALNVPVMLAECEGMGEDLVAIENWAAIFTEPKKLTETITKNWLLHRKAIDADIGSIKTDWGTHEYFKAGVVAADLLTVAIGPIVVEPTNEMQSNDMLGFSAMAIPDYIAGFLYGWTGDNNLTEVEACYSSDLPIVQDLKTAAEDVLDGQLLKAALKFKQAYSSLSVALEPCKNMSNDLAALKAWGDGFIHPAHLVEELAIHWEFQHEAIKQAIGQTEVNWNSHMYFQSGKATAEAFTLLFGKVE